MELHKFEVGTVNDAGALKFEVVDRNENFVFIEIDLKDGSEPRRKRRKAKMGLTEKSDFFKGSDQTEYVEFARQRVEASDFN